MRWIVVFIVTLLLVSVSSAHPWDEEACETILDDLYKKTLDRPMGVYCPAQSEKVTLEGSGSGYTYLGNVLHSLQLHLFEFEKSEDLQRWANDFPKEPVEQNLGGGDYKFENAYIKTDGMKVVVIHAIDVYSTNFKTKDKETAIEKYMSTLSAPVIDPVMVDRAADVLQWEGDVEYDADALFFNEIRIKDFRGDVEVSAGEGASFTTPVEGDLLREGFMLNTGLDSEVVLEFPDGSEVLVRDLTLVVLDEFFFNEEQQDTILDLRRGSVRARVKPTKGIRAGFSVVTPTATASVRGTEFEVLYNEDSGESSVKTFEGSVAVEDKVGNSVDLTAGTEVLVGESLGKVVVFDESLKTSGSSLWFWVVALIVVVFGGGFWFIKKKS